MPVRDKDRRAPRTERRERQSDLRGRPARIHHQRLGGVSPGPDDIAVRRERSEGELVDDRRHDRECTDALDRFAAGRGAIRLSREGVGPDRDRGARRDDRSERSDHRRRRAGDRDPARGRPGDARPPGSGSGPGWWSWRARRRSAAATRSSTAESARSSPSTRPSGTQSGARPAPASCSSWRRGPEMATTPRAGHLLAGRSPGPAHRIVVGADCRRRVRPGPTSATFSAGPVPANGLPRSPGERLSGPPDFALASRFSCERQTRRSMK